jgi:hypothetical protein
LWALMAILLAAAAETSAVCFTLRHRRSRAKYRSGIILPPDTTEPA